MCHIIQFEHCPHQCSTPWLDGLSVVSPPFSTANGGGKAGLQHFHGDGNDIHVTALLSSSLHQENTHVFGSCFLAKTFHPW